ncbi:hypothetical protein BU15DRAFT_77426 [Melanogaster broomeanus]|nr:hypothetical protein BU15DRAFT_77426 [Melanogaster broomeanus]
MVILDKYHDSDPDIYVTTSTSYDAITSDASGRSSTRTGSRVNEKTSWQSSFTPSSNIQNTSDPPLRPSQSNSSSWLSKLSFVSSRTSKQVRQTVRSLVRDLVTNPQSLDILDSCADACRTHGLDLSALMQEPSIEDHSAIYWAIVNHCESLLPSLLAHAAPLTSATISDVRLACLVTSDEQLFQALRCRREPFTKQNAPLSTSSDALVLGSTPADDISVRELDGEGAFVADIRISLWQKRIRVSGRVSVEFIARGRIWSLTFFSTPSTGSSITGKAVGAWQVALCLLEHSPPTFIDSRLVVDTPPQSSVSPTPASPSEVNDLTSLLPPPPEAPSNSPVRLAASPAPSPPTKSKSKSKTLQTIEVRHKSVHRLAHPPRISSMPLSTLHSRATKTPGSPHGSNTGRKTVTSAIVAPLGEGAGAKLLYDNMPFIAADGTLHVRLDARLGKPEASDCVIC